MSNKFLTTSSSSDLSKQFVFAGSLGANNLNPSQALKTDSARRLISANMNVSDITGLQARLDSTIVTPYEGNIQAYNFVSSSSNLNALAVTTSNLASELLAMGSTISAVDQRTQNISHQTEGSTTVTGDLFFTDKLSSIVNGPVMTAQSVHDFVTTGSIACLNLQCEDIALGVVYPSLNNTLNEIQNTMAIQKPGKYSMTGVATTCTTTTPTSLIGTGVGSKIFELKTLKTGDSYDVYMSGTIRTKDGNQELKLDVFLGSTLMHTTTFIDLDNVGAPFSFEWMVRFTCKLQGAAASFYSSSKFFYSTGTSVNASLRGWLQNTSSIQNTSIQNTIDVRGQWNSNQVENNMTVNALCVSKCY